MPLFEIPVWLFPEGGQSPVRRLSPLTVQRTRHGDVGDFSVIRQHAPDALWRYTVTYSEGDDPGPTYVYYTYIQGCVVAIISELYLIHLQGLVTNSPTR